MEGIALADTFVRFFEINKGTCCYTPDCYQARYMQQYEKPSYSDLLGTNVCSLVTKSALRFLFPSFPLWDACKAVQAPACSLSTYAASSEEVTPSTVFALITVHYIVQHFWARVSEIYRLPGDNHFKKKDQWYASQWRKQQVPIAALLEGIKHLHKLFKGRNDH